MRVLLLGPPGAGKGTQSARIAERFEVPHISTGDMFREAISQRTKMGSKAQEYMDSGLLVPDEVVLGMVEERFQKPDVKTGYVLDGFPRTREQAEFFQRFAEQADLPLQKALALSVADEVVVNRVAGRRTCRNTGKVFHLEFNPPPADEAHLYDLYQRPDDKEETVRDRVATYHRDTAPLIEFYRDCGVLAQVDGTGSMDSVFDRLVAALQS